ncbi:transition state regulatory protein AbrB [Bacillus sp. JCM 19046]|uniref:Transcriptional pleiotropic regulator of transition state genes n=1 Tax=Shouchella xiaoxiensis TaxID=766895 RepID=A0ABS2SQQ6_9BACI|nr:AbrB/MazE/SpoVT family DNA-binding domain-containing protein [Shouchella xiaoxiensis]MBM7837859.1 transcriptional pleiotropic regulator of transition state genes [Shouchella xiaoxiensis]GAF13795.1 transcriptional pleiotropic regulator of transition state genes [Bacillus sp. JCM 19045]GAF18821.1 transition state regulatory protein AbrB [Bacillus sp. JCM 19046]
MASTGITRKLDNLGRIVMPKEMRDMLHIYEKTPLEIFVEEDKIILQRYQPEMACILTGEISPDNLLIGDGEIVLSKEGAKLLMEEIEKLTVYTR